MEIMFNSDMILLSWWFDNIYIYILWLVKHQSHWQHLRVAPFPKRLCSRLLCAPSRLKDWIRPSKKAYQAKKAPWPMFQDVHVLPYAQIWRQARLNPSLPSPWNKWAVLSLKVLLRRKTKLMIHLNTSLGIAIGNVDVVLWWHELQWWNSHSQKSKNCWLCSGFTAVGRFLHRHLCTSEPTNPISCGCTILENFQFIVQLILS